MVSYRGERNLDYRCVYAIKYVICVKTGLDWRNLRFTIELIRKKGKQHDNSDATFRMVSTTNENWQTRSDFSESRCSYLLFVVMGYAAVNLKLF